MLNLIRVTSDNEDFQHLVGLLDQQLNERNGALQLNYHKFNVIAAIDTVVVAKIDGQPVGCGCFKQFDKDAVEIKRMFVKPEHRGTGIATRILSELESWAAGLGFSRSVLETGKKQLEAINLYKKRGYAQIENYGQYAGMENSVCFARRIKSPSAPAPPSSIPV
jgi:putative acetyltransferase